MPLLHALLLALSACLFVTWAIGVARAAGSPVPEAHRRRMLQGSSVGMLSALLPAAISFASLIAAAVAFVCAVALLAVLTPRLDRWEAQGRLELVRQGRDAYTGQPRQAR